VLSEHSSIQWNQNSCNVTGIWICWYYSTFWRDKIHFFCFHLCRA